ncbi:hypothetical protein H0H92_001008 [Tricholoma furcatifolium]|nr:hypothetical protein H0H92_001008 [Tricholoma furcatifolium]
MLSSSPPRAPPIQYAAPLGTRWAKEKAAAGGDTAFDLPTDPKNIGPWILGECVGKGASGRVKIAKHRLTGQLAAVKILPVAPLVSSRASLATQQAKSDKQRLGIDKEITMMKLMNHPNIMRIYDVFEGDKELFLVLEYIEGGELFDFLVNRGRLPPSEALAYFKQIIYGLNYAHTFSIIHRDLKPENILIASISPPLIKIADWGMAAFAHPSLQLDTSCGSPHYASPEIVNGQSYKGNATDIWSCGVILYALLTGRLPFDDKNVRVLLQKVKSGKYDMPAWIDPLAKDLLEKMLVVDVEKRITPVPLQIPEILAHPWFKLSSNESSSVPTETDLAIAQLPPSPSTLARPISSPSAIDPELLASLRVIWGRHADANGDSIKRDLCSPAGQGVHAKAFYFLLARYREESMRNNLELNDCPEVGINVKDLNLNLGWELDRSTVSKKYEGSRALLSVEVQAKSPPSSPVSLPKPAPVPPSLRCARGSSGARERASSPVGPRAPFVVSGRPGIEAWRLQSQAVNDFKFRPPINSPQPVMPIGPGRTVPRPPPSRRGYTYSHPVSENIVSTIQFPKHLQAEDIVNLQRPSNAAGPSGARRSSMFVTSPNPSTERPDLPMAAIPSPSSTPVASPIPAIYAPVPIPVSKTPLAIESMAEPPEEAHQAAPAEEVLNAETGIIASESLPPSPSPESGATGDHNAEEPLVATPGQCAASIAQDRENKENQSIGDESWSYVESPEQKGRGLGFGVGREGGRAMGNVTNTRDAFSGAKGKKREKKNRPTTLDFRNLQQKRSTVSRSQTALSPPAVPPASSSRLLTSPVVGEFKGWFSNLFNWKNHNSTQGGVLYSADNVFRTRASVGRILEDLGVVIEGGGFDRGMSQADFTAPLKCRLEDLGGVRTATHTLKPVRFRIEFSVAPTHDQDVVLAMVAPLPQPSHPDPVVAPPPFVSGATNGPGSSAAWARGSGKNTGASPLLDIEFPPGSACAIYMAYEKGSVSAFRVIWRRLKEAYGSGSVAAVYPISSPTMASTPLPQHPEFERFVAA